MGMCLHYFYLQNLHLVIFLPLFNVCTNECFRIDFLLVELLFCPFSFVLKSICPFVKCLNNFLLRHAVRNAASLRLQHLVLIFQTQILSVFSIVLLKHVIQLLALRKIFVHLISNIGTQSFNFVFHCRDFRLFQIQVRESLFVLKQFLESFRVFRLNLLFKLLDGWPGHVHYLSLIASIFFLKLNLSSCAHCLGLLTLQSHLLSCNLLGHWRC